MGRKVPLPLPSAGLVYQMSPQGDACTLEKRPTGRSEKAARREQWEARGGLNSVPPKVMPSLDPYNVTAFGNRGVCKCK